VVTRTPGLGGYCHQLMRRDDAVIVMTTAPTTPGSPVENTSCGATQQDIELNREKAGRRSQHVTLRVKGRYRLLYTPWMKLSR